MQYFLDMVSNKNVSELDAKCEKSANLIFNNN